MNTKKFFTQEEYDAANSVSIVAMVENMGYALKRIDAKRQTIAGHESFSIEEEKNCFTRFSKGTNYGGGVIQIVSELNDMNTVEAVHYINEQFGIRDFPVKNAYYENKRNISNQTNQKEIIAKKQNPENFKLPIRSKKHNAAFAYLNKTRCIDRDIISEMMHQRKLFQTTFNYNGNNFHNCVFVGLDDEGNPASATVRMIGKTDKRSWRIVKDSNTLFSFTMEGKNNKLCVYESAIDALSGATLDNLIGRDWHQDHRLSLNGLSAQPLDHYLSKHQEITHIAFCLDNDEIKNRIDGRNRGQERANELQNKYIRLGYKTEKQIPQEKDFNAALVKYLHSLEAQNSIKEDTEWER